MSFVTVIRRLDPAFDLTVHFDRGEGAWLVTDCDGMYVVERCDTKAEAQQVLAARQRRQRRLRYVVGHLLGLANVAAGRVDRWLRDRPTKADLQPF